MTGLVVSLFGGAALGGTFALIGLGLVLAFRATSTLSFAQGQFMLLAAFIVGYWQAHQIAPVWLGILVGLVVAGSVSTAFYLLVLQRTMGLPHFLGFVATLGLASILDGVMGLLFGSNQYVIRLPGLPTGAAHIWGGRVAWATIVIAGVTLVIALGVIGLLRFTELGIRIHAAGRDPILASQSGINVRRLYAGSWALAGVLAAIAGVAFGATNIVNTSLENLALAAFPVILLGGLDSVEGAVIGGVLIGILQGLVATYLGGQYLDVVTYGVLLGILLLRPQGLLGTREVRRV